MKCVAYARAASRPQVVAEDVSLITKQIQEIEAWAKENGHVIVDKYIDEGKSAIDYNRPGFQRIIHDAISPEHQFDAIVVTSISRLFRDVVKLEEFENLIERHKVGLISITQPNWKLSISNNPYMG
jgi:site-specific DNA recombinase